MQTDRSKDIHAAAAEGHGASYQVAYNRPVAAPVLDLACHLIQMPSCLARQLGQIVAQNELKAEERIHSPSRNLLEQAGDVDTCLFEDRAGMERVHANSQRKK